MGFPLGFSWDFVGFSMVFSIRKTNWVLPIKFRGGLGPLPET